MLVSCIMPTADRRPFVPGAIACFLRQDYAPRELVIVDDGADAVGDLVPADPRIRYLRTEPGLTLGAKRNRACAEARGEVVAHWDDDDWYPPDRLSRQVAALQARGADVCGSSRVYYRDAAGGHAWEYVYGASGRPWVGGNTLAYRRTAWERTPFPAVRVAEDSRFVWSHAASRVADLADPGLCIAAIHPGNTSPKRPAGVYWKPVEPAVLDGVIAQAERRARLPSATADAFAPEAAADPPAGTRGRALVAVAAGIGDVVRATPLVRVLHRLGYAVDVLCGADYPPTAQLLAGAPEVARVVAHPNPSADRGRTPCPALAGVEYDVACFTYWARPLERQVRARARRRFEPDAWLREGDSRCVERMARELGWTGPLPDPFVVPAPRDFGLPPGTVALHAGCKRAWPWKKWHGFADLAERLEHVAVIGTGEDLDAAGTYFGTPFRWPPHVRDFTGRLSLPETAALIGQCAALVCNDSGMQHVGAAVGTPTYPVFGITSPAREAIPLSHVRPVTAGLPCEPECRRQPWGRRDCHRHLECLKTMSAEHILERIRRDGVVLPGRAAVPAAPRHAVPAETAVPAVPAETAVPAVPAETVTVAVRIDGGIGDVLLASPLLEALYDDLGRCEIDVFYHQPEAARFIFSGARFVRAVHPASQLAAAERRYDLAVRTLQFVRYAVHNPARLQRVAPEFAERMREAARRLESVRGLAERQPALDGLWGRISVAAGRNVLDSIGWLGGADVTRDSELFLAPDPSAYAALEAHVGTGRRYVTLHDGFDNSTAIPAGGATKCWPLEHWAGLVSELRARLPDLLLVQLGAGKSRHIPGVDVDLVGRTTLHEAAWILKQAALHVDTDSGLAHLSRALHTPAVVLFGPTDAAYYGHACNTNLAAGTCGNCWWSTPDWLSRCPRGLARPACMESIAPAAVAEHAVARLDAVRPLRAQGGAVACYDGALRDADRPALARMCEALELPLLPISQHIRNERTGVYIHASKQWEYLYALRGIEELAGPGAQALRVADLGGGRGALAPYLAHRGHAVEIFDLDYLWDHGADPTVEPRFRRWAREAGFRARFGSLYNVPAQDGAYDVVTCISVVEHVPYKEYVLREALRILRPGGMLVLTFDFANAPERFENGARREIFSPGRLACTLGRLGIPFTPADAAEVDRSARRAQADGVCGLPDGMTVAGMLIRKAPPDRAPDPGADP
jgi:ADP-heptose:LPS heptosyltransferase/SAM-dependent methyltransferase